MIDARGYAPFEPQTWWEDEAGFAAELARGRQAEFRVATALLPLGLSVKVGPLLSRQGLASKDARLIDQADVEIGGGHRLEVKARKFAFTTPADYPFETAFVGSIRRWKERPTLPCGVVLVSEPTGCLLFAPTSLSHTWTVESRHDMRRNIDERSVAVPRTSLFHQEALFVHLRRPCVEGTR